jgi:pyruvate formate-lyase activating enzyme-like uncharacterized protein
VLIEKGVFKGVVSGGRLARGCELCYPGAKAVIFITGTCDDSCFYCPVSRDRLYHEVMFVNEEPVSGVEEVVVEVTRMGAMGASITGGDPLTAIDRFVDVIRSLKENLGYGFHIHLYTTGRQASVEVLRTLWASGLDEIRFHPVDLRFLRSVEWAVRHTGMSVGIEIPIAPGLEEWAKKVILEASRIGVSFVNLNEMEFVEPNSTSLRLKGYRESRRRPFTVEGALETALKVVGWARDHNLAPVHFCPAPFKDSIQTRNRMRRLATLDRSWYEKPTNDGTVIWAEVRNEDGTTVVAHPDLIREMRGWKPTTIVEAHPTRGRLRISEYEYDSTPS